MEPLQARIVTIISPTEFVIDKGEAHDVKTGTKFDIIAKEIQVVGVDGESLGSFVYIKGTIYASDVYERFTLCRTGTKAEWEESAFPFGIVGAKRRTKTLIDIELPIDKWNAEKVEREVKVGDTVVQVVQSEQA